MIYVFDKEKVLKPGKTRLMNQLIIVFLALSILSCGTSTDDSNRFRVEYKGALKNFMMKGDISAKANLSDFKETKHLYALGAIEDLKGEIQIFNGTASNTFVVDSTLIFDNTFSKKAALLVYASVEKWNKIEIPENVSTVEQLEAYIEQTAKENRVNIEQPFPFLIEGTAKTFAWHVIDWADGDTEHTQAKHKNSGLRGTVKEAQVDILGFYSNAHHTIFTHHTTNMHLHVKSTDNKIAGHLDDLILGKDMILKLPITDY